MPLSVLVEKQDGKESDSGTSSTAKVSAETTRQKDKVLAPPKKTKTSSTLSSSSTKTSVKRTVISAKTTSSSTKLRWNWGKKKYKKKKKKTKTSTTSARVKKTAASSAAIPSTTTASTTWNWDKNKGYASMTTPASSTKVPKTVKAPAASLANSTTPAKPPKAVKKTAASSANSTTPARRTKAPKAVKTTAASSSNSSTTWNWSKKEDDSIHIFDRTKKANKATAKKSSLTKHTTAPRQTKTALKTSLSSLSPTTNIPTIPPQPKRARYSSVETDVGLNAKKKDVTVSAKKASLQNNKQKKPSKKASTHATANTQASNPSDNSLPTENASVETGSTVNAGDKSPVTQKKKTPARTKKASTQAATSSADSEEASLPPEKSPAEKDVAVNTADKSAVTKKRKIPVRRKKKLTLATVNTQALKPPSDSETEDEDWTPDPDLTKKKATSSRAKKPASKTSLSHSNVAIVDSSLPRSDMTTRKKNASTRMCWSLMLSQLEKFHQEHGHFDIRKVKHSDDTLAKWVTEQQHLYLRDKAGNKVKNLTEERVHLLNEIGFDWDGPPIDWDEVLKACADCKAELGHLRIAKYQLDPKHKTLYQIAYRIRQEYKCIKDEGTSQILTPERIDQLNALEFVWGWTGQSYPDDNWNAKYHELKGYIEKYGEFPRSCHSYPRSGPLYEWIVEQRKEYRAKLKQEKGDSTSTEVQVKLQDDQIIKLKALGPGFANPIQVRVRVFKPPTTQAGCERDEKYFDGFIQRLQGYQKEYGNCSVPLVYRNDQGLANWCTKQRRMYKLAGTESPSWPLTTERVRILNDMGFTWDVVLIQEVEQGEMEQHEAEQHEVKQHKVKQHKVKQHKVKQHKVKQHEVKQDKGTDDAWDSFFSMLSDFKAEYGHTHVFKPDLSSWCKAQRRQRTKFDEDPSTSTLTQERIDSLESIKFSWKTITYKNHHWMERFNQLKEFKSKRGHCVVFTRYTQHDGLAVWVRHQRRQYIKHQAGIRNELNPERIEALDSIDFASELNRSTKKKTNKQACNPEQFWDDRFQELQNYFDKMGHSLVPADYEANPVLGAWAGDQRKKYTRLQNGYASDLTPERIEKLESLDFAWSFTKGRKTLERDWGVGREIVNSLINSEPERDISQTTTTRPVLDNLPPESTNESGYRILANQNWDVRYAELKRFCETTGHCLVNHTLTTNITLVNWVITQRKEYRNSLKGRVSTLNAYRRGKLQEINFPWNPALERTRRIKMGKAEEDTALIESLVERGISFKDENMKTKVVLRVAWEERFQQLVEYKSMHGHCNVPGFYSTNKALGRWVTRCRQSYKLFLKHGRSGCTPGNNSINQERIVMLDNIGFMWDDDVAKKKREREGEDKSPEKKKKARISGVMNVSRSIESPVPVPQHDNLLGSLTPLPLEERATYAAQNNDFDEPASHLLSQNGNLDEPSTFFPHNDDSDGEMGNNIDFDTDEPDNLFSENDKHAEEHKSERKVQQEEKLQEIWNAHFEELKEFRQKTGHCLVPYSFASKKLATFVRVQRRNYGMLKSGESKRMTQERYDLLTSIGFVWDAKKEMKKRESLGLSEQDKNAVLQLESELPKVENANNNWIPSAFHEEKWQARLDDLRLYKNVHGNCNVKKYYSELNNLGKWVCSVRIKAKKFREGKPSAITMERIAALEEIGFIFENPRQSITAEWDNFNERYCELVEYKSKFGDCKVPTAYENEALGYWVTVQRMRYKLRQNNKKSLMTDEQEQMLNAVDFIWAIRERNGNRWKENYALLKEYKETLGNKPDVDPFPLNCTYNGNDDLKKWAVAQRSNHKRFKEGRNSNITQERADLLVEIGFIKPYIK